MDEHGKRADIFRRLFYPHMNTLYKAALRLTGRADDAEDLVQDLLVKLYPKTEQLQKIEALEPWLKKALYRQFIDGLRKRKTRPENFINASGRPADEMETGDPDPETLAQRAQDRQLVNEALYDLEPENRLLVIMHLVEGYRISELEEIFGIPAQTLKTRLRRAKIRLRNFLQK